MKAAAWPPLVPTLRSVTAGFAVAVVALEYSVATAVGAARACTGRPMPWNCIVWSVMPAPGPVSC